MKDIKRQLQKAIEKRIGDNKVLLLFGTRRVGKTKLLQAIQQNYRKPCLVLNAEDLDVQATITNRTAANYKRLIGKHKLIMIDEAQAVPAIGTHLKFMIDSFPKITIIATGSSSFDLMNKSGEPLTGRSYQYTLYPVSYAEVEGYVGHLGAQQQLQERLIYGSYPELITLTGNDEKEDYLKSLVQTYLLKDILMYETVKNASKIFDLLKLLAYQVGNEVSLDELGRNLGMSKNTVVRYLDLLSKVFVIFRVGGYSSNLRKEVVKSSKWYFYDNGIRNAVINDFREVNSRNDMGVLWENYCFYERIKVREYAAKTPEYFFWRTYDNQEIDMIETESRQLRAFEFKWKKCKGVKPPKFFEENYPKAKFSCVSQDTLLDFLA